MQVRIGCDSLVQRGNVNPKMCDAACFSMPGLTIKPDWIGIKQIQVIDNRDNNRFASRPCLPATVSPYAIDGRLKRILAVADDEVTLQLRMRMTQKKRILLLLNFSDCLFDVIDDLRIARMIPWFRTVVTSLQFVK